MKSENLENGECQSQMRKSELLDRFSLVLIGCAIGYFLGMLVKVLELPEWVQIFGVLLLVSGFFVFSLYSQIYAEREKNEERQQKSQGWHIHNAN